MQGIPFGRACDDEPIDGREKRNFGRVPGGRCRARRATLRPRPAAVADRHVDVDAAVHSLPSEANHAGNPVLRMNSVEGLPREPVEGRLHEIVKMSADRRGTHFLRRSDIEAVEPHRAADILEKRLAGSVESRHDRDVVTLTNEVAREIEHQIVTAPEPAGAGGIERIVDHRYQQNSHR